MHLLDRGVDPKLGDLEPDRHRVGDRSLGLGLASVGAGLTAGQEQEGEAAEDKAGDSVHLISSC